MGPHRMCSCWRTNTSRCYRYDVGTANCNVVCYSGDPFIGQLTLIADVGLCSDFE